MMTRDGYERIHYRERGILKEKTSTLWKEAYDEAVRKITQYEGFQSKSWEVFEKLSVKFPNVDPFAFISCNFPPYRTWWKKNGDKWVEIKYPFPMMLLGPRALEHYEKHRNKLLNETGSRKEAIIKAVEGSMKRLTACKTPIMDFQRVWDLYSVGVVSPYLVLMLPNMRQWIQAQMKAKLITIEEWHTLMQKEKVLDSYNGLNIELAEMVRQA